MSRKKIYGLTVKQWTALLGVVIGFIVFGCRACYNFISDHNANNSNVATEPNRGNNNKPSRPTQNPASSLNVEQATEIYLKLGNPSAANNSDPNNRLMVNPYYALSYNRTRGTANWVAWRVTQADIGNVERANDFRPDQSLPQDFPLHRIAWKKRVVRVVPGHTVPDKPGWFPLRSFPLPFRLPQ